MLEIGILVAGAGSYFLLEGGGVPGVGGSGSIMNLHLAQIAKNAIYLGYFLVLVGSVRFRKFEPAKAPK
ncbi:hypothetical protein GOB92_33565 [Sinorhizobium meliloti]|nr:hypothetical protein [Sinorhizobium meliloti]